jgi:predicted PurR-regulated permease PerM
MLAAMKPRSADEPEDRVFLWTLGAITLAFLWILWPFYGTILWATVLAILFTPLDRRLVQSMHGRRTSAALATLAIILLIVILPVALITGMLVQEAANLYARIQSGQLDFGRYATDVFGAMPAWMSSVLDRFGLTSLGVLQERLTASIARASRFLAGQALSVGQNAFDFLLDFFIMVYLLFFFLRDGDALASRIKEAVPLRADHLRDLSRKFTVVIRATVKGNIVVAIVQGALGGILFAFLGIPAPVFWGVLMAFLSLLPAVGAAIVWLPVAVYLLITGSVWQGVFTIGYGVLVIGLVDNVLRPVLVGKDTKMPDFVVLMSTLGGMVIFGFNGFVIGPVIAATFIAAWDIYAQTRARARVP